MRKIWVCILMSLILGGANFAAAGPGVGGGGGGDNPGGGGGGVIHHSEIPALPTH